MKMGKKVREYKAGDFIFAKVKGYPAWPARVQRPNGKKYFVYFYGTGETANLPPNMIFDYAENKDKFLSKAVKRRDFNDGVKQIEHDFANNVPLEQVIGVAMEVPEESANDTANDSAINDMIDDTTADTTAADDTGVADESAADTTAQNEPMIEDSDETGALVIDEGKKGRKPVAKPPLVAPKLMKEPKTPRGKKKEDVEENKEEEKKDEEIVSRSGRKIRPKRYIDEQTEENTTLPSPAPKKRRGASPTQDKEEKNDKMDSKNKSEKADKSEKSGKQLNTVSQAELEDLKEPFTLAGDDKENILIAYLPHGQYVGIKLFQSRPTSFKNEPARLQWDKQQAQHAITMKQQLEKGQITSQSVITQLVMDLNLTDEEKATLDKERETEEKKSRVQFLKTEMKLIELEAKIKTCLCLEKADTDLCLKLLDEFMELEIKPLMLLKHPSCGETVKRLRAYVGNAPSWELSESAALLFAKQAHRIRRRADALYRRVKELFTVPEGLSFWEFFSERVETFKKATSKLSPDELLELVHEPLEMSVPTSHTMKAAIEAANEEDTLEDDSSAKKNTAGKQKKPTNNSTPSKPAVKRQSSRKQQEDKEKEKEQNAEQEKNEEASTENAEKDSKGADKAGEQKDSMEVEQSNDKTVNSTEETNSEDTPTDNSEKDIVDDKTNSEKDDTVKVNDSLSEKGNKNKDESEKVNKSKDDSDKGTKTKEDPEKSNKDKEDPEKVNKTKDDTEKGDKNKDDTEKGSKSKDDSEKASKNKDDTEKSSKIKNNSNKDQSKSKSPSPNDKEKDNSKSPKEAKGSDKSKEDKAQKSKEDKIAKEDKTDKTEEKDKEDEPRAKRSRESKKTDVPPRSPTKRKSKF